MTIIEINKLVSSLDLKKLFTNLLKKLFLKELLVDVRCINCNKKIYAADINKDSVQEFICKCKKKNRVVIEEGVIDISII